MCFLWGQEQDNTLHVNNGRNLSTLLVEEVFGFKKKNWQDNLMLFAPSQWRYSSFDSCVKIRTKYSTLGGPHAHLAVAPVAFLTY